MKILQKSEIKRIVENAVRKLETYATTYLVEDYYNNDKNFNIEKVVEESIDEYFNENDYIEDVQDYLPEKYFNEDGTFNDREEHKEKIKETLYDSLEKALREMLEDYIENFDDTDPHDLSTYGLSQSDFL